MGGQPTKPLVSVATSSTQFAQQYVKAVWRQSLLGNQFFFFFLEGPARSGQHEKEQTMSNRRF